MRILPTIPPFRRAEGDPPRTTFAFFRWALVGAWGGILWAAGEVVAILIFGALRAQWARASEREARRIDRALDRAEATTVTQPQ